MENIPRFNTGEADKESSASSLLPTFDIERVFLAKGYRYIAGADEAGRGSLAGPLCVGLVMYRAEYMMSPVDDLTGIRDSKKMTPRSRERILSIIRARSMVTHYVMVSHRTVDRLNVNAATEFALTRLLEGIDIQPDLILLDGNFSFHLPVPVLPVVKGDGRSISIASAGIAAKVNRDMVMEKMDGVYCGFNFKKNKGYGTREHIAAIKKRGYCPIHRVSYEPVRTMVSRGGDGTNADSF